MSCAQSHSASWTEAFVVFGERVALLVFISMMYRTVSCGENMHVHIA